MDDALKPSRAPKFHTNAFVANAEPSALSYETEQPDGSVVAHYEDGHTVEFKPNDGRLRLAHRPEFPGGDRTARKLDTLHAQLNESKKPQGGYI